MYFLPFKPPRIERHSEYLSQNFHSWVITTPAIFRLSMAGLALLFCVNGHALEPIAAFVRAARANDAAFIEQMAQLGLGEGSRDQSRNNLLMLAIQEGSDAFSLSLLRQRAWQSKSVLEHENQLGETALMLSALKGSERVAKRIMELGARVNKPGWTPLHYAAISGNGALIRMLTDKSAALNAPGPFGLTPLMIATIYGQRLVVGLLLELGADPTLKNELGQTARDLANEGDNKDLSFILEIQEIVFKSNQLMHDPNFDSDVGSRPESKKSVRSSSKDPLQPVDDTSTRAAGVEVFKGIQ